MAEQAEQLVLSIEEPVLVSKQNTTSRVWTFFGFIQDDFGKPKDCNKPTCKLCKSIVSAKYGNTTNLYHHLKLKHPKKYLEVKPTYASEAGRSQTITNAFLKTQKMSTSSREHHELTRAITVCLAKDMLPLYLVDKPGFRKMLEKFNSRYQIPKKDHFSRIAIPGLYNEVRSNVEKEISSHNYFFAITGDLWSSCTSEPYLAFTIHFIDSDWVLQARCLQVHYLPQDHTGEHLKEAFRSTLQEWKLDESNLTAATTDSGSNIKLACRLLGWRRLSCFGHNLDLAINKGIKDHRIDRVLRLCKSIVAAFSSSWKRKRELRTVQDQKGLPVKCLKSDVSTRWGSTADMVERILQQREAINVVLVGDPKVSHLVLRWQDVDVLESIIAALAPLRDITDLLSGEKRVTVSLIKPLLQHVYKELSSTEEDTALTSEVKAKIKADLEQRYEAQSEVDEFLDFCSFLDPRFKQKYSSDQVVIDRVFEKMVLCAASLVDPVDDGVVSHSSGLEPPSKKRAGCLSQILGSSITSCSTNDLSDDDKARRELEMYLQQYPTLDIDSCPLKWYKEEQKRLPLLSALASKYLSVCATSVSSERAFSSGGHIVNCKRSCLKPDKVNQLVFLSKNL